MFCSVVIGLVVMLIVWCRVMGVLFVVFCSCVIVDMFR